MSVHGDCCRRTKRGEQRKSEVIHISKRSRNLSGVIRVTTVESLPTTPLLSEFMELYPDINVEVITAGVLISQRRGHR